MPAYKKLAYYLSLNAEFNEGLKHDFILTLL
jgi:hypothetical protein